MSHKSMDPAEFRERLEWSFGAEPPHAATEEDLSRGRWRLRRHRAAGVVGGLVVASVVAAGASAVPAVLTGPGGEVGPAAGGGAMTDPAVVATCMRKENVVHVASGSTVSEERALALMGEPTLVTRATAKGRVEATLVSDDGKYWGECQFATEPDNGVKNAMSVYPTDVSFPHRKVAGVKAYEPANEADPRLAGTVTPPLPQLEVPCVSALDGPAGDEFDSRCPEFTMYWNDRRPAEVAAARVVTPDGVSTWADVHEGYLSFAYTGEMTPRMASKIARGDHPGAKRVVFYDHEGNVLVDDRRPGRAPGRRGAAIRNFPSLAWWLK